MQPHSLLQTKLYIPPVRPELVPRPRLIERLNAGLPDRSGLSSTREAFPRALTLVSAPAGFGKTTLVSEWVQAIGGSAPPIGIAWLSLDEGDNDPARFLAYLIAALRTLGRGKAEGIEPQPEHAAQQAPIGLIGKGVLSALRSPQPPPPQAVLTPLINEIAAYPGSIILVLDDHHAIQSSAVDKALAFLLERLPPQMHLVIATREDPHLPLARLRAQGQLTELRAADLRFTSSEAAEFLDQAMGLGLSAEDIAILESRAEGWIAGLQLAALSMQGRKDVSSLIHSFTGSHRFVLDYLIEEVLQQQPESIQTFLLQTSVLNRLTGSLCDAVRFGAAEPPSSSSGTALTDQDNGQQTLEYLEHANLFVVPLDDERRWYRYHHLFADLLRQRLHQTQASLQPALHSRASKWYEENNLTEDAVDHALAARDFERAAQLIEGQVDATWKRGEHAKILGWLNALPKEQLSSRPHLSIFQAWVQLEDGRLGEAEQSLQAVERAIQSIEDKASAEESRQFGQLNTAHLKSRVSVMRAMMAFHRADVPSIIRFSHEALEYLPEEDLSWRGIAAMALADSHYIDGNMNAANDALSEAIKISRIAGNVYIAAYTSIKLAIVLQYQGRLDQALEICRDLMAFLDSNGLSQSALAGLVQAQWGEILWDLDDIDRALQLTTKGIELNQYEIDVTNLAWAHLVLVKLLYAKTDLAGAMETILKLEQTARESHVPPWIVSRIAAWKAKIWLKEGNKAALRQWVQEHLLDTDGEPLFVREVEYLVFARILILRGELEEAVNLVERLIERAQAGGRVTRQIEMYLVLALAVQELGDTNKAMSTLSKSLSLAESRGHIRLFVNEGPPMARLLYEALSRDIFPGYVRQLLAAFPNVEPTEQIERTRAQAPASDLVEPLSERELEVLQLIAEGLTNREIASRLFLSLNTVKAHTRNIYGKLCVHNRTQAVTRARALGVLPTP
jgi:LuxR family maltose regulon positive regulatory protein